MFLSQSLSIDLYWGPTNENGCKEQQIPHLLLAPKTNNFSNEKQSTTMPSKMPFGCIWTFVICIKGWHGKCARAKEWTYPFYANGLSFVFFCLFHSSHLPLSKKRSPVIQTHSMQRGSCFVMCPFAFRSSLIAYADFVLECIGTCQCLLAQIRHMTMNEHWCFEC